MIKHKLATHSYNFHSLEVVDRVSETQLQVGENCPDSETIFKYELSNTFILCITSLTDIFNFSHST